MSVTSPSPATDARSGKLRPGGIWYVIGTLLILGGLAALIGLIAAGAVKTSRAVDRYARFVVSKEGTEATIDVTQAGSYTFYYESQSTVEHKQYTAPADPPPDLQVAAKARGGADLVVSPSTNEKSFSISGKVGRAVFSVRVPAPGTYVVRATGGTAATPFVVSMGKGQVGRLAAYIVSGLGLGALLGIAGLVTLIVTGSKRKKSRRAQLAMAASLPHGGPFWSGPASSVSGATPTGPWSSAAPAPSGTGYSPPGYAQPGYSPPGYAQPGYSPPGYAQPGYAQPGVPLPPANGLAGVPAPPAHAPRAFGQPDVPTPPAYAQPGPPPSGFGQPGQPPDSPPATPPSGAGVPGHPVPTAWAPPPPPSAPPDASASS